MHGEIRLFRKIARKVNGNWEKIWQQVRLDRKLCYLLKMYLPKIDQESKSKNQFKFKGKQY